jgi:hypothetical protein
MSNIVFGTSAGNANVGASWVGGTAPGTGDTAVFHAASGACTIPASTTVTWGAVDFTGLGVSSYTGTFTFAATTSVLTVGSSTLGSCVFVAGMTVTLTGIGTINLVGSTASTTYNFSSAGLVMPNVTVNAGTTTTYQFDAVTTGSTASVTLSQGGLNTNNAAQSWGQFSSSNSNTRILTMGSSAITLTSTGQLWITSTSTGLTITANTAVVTCNGAGGGAFLGGGLNFNGMSLVLAGSGTPSIQGAGNTFANVTRTGTAVKTDGLQLNVGFTVTGTLTLTGNSLTNRLLVQSNTVGTARTITAASVSLTNCDFMDITGAGAATWSGTSLGDCQGNSGITFTAEADQTWSGNTTGNWSAAANWTSRVPLPQDNVLINGLSSGTVTCDMPRMGKNIDFTGSTGGTFTGNTHGMTATSFGNLTLNSAVTMTPSSGNGFASWVLSGRSSQTITCNGATIPGSVSVVASGGTYTISSAYTSGGDIGTVTGTIDNTVGNYTFTIVGRLLCSGGTWKLGSATYNITSSATATPISINAGTFTATNATINILGAGTFTRTINVVTATAVTIGTLTYTVANSPGPLLFNFAVAGCVIGTFNIGPGRVWTNTAGTTCTINNVVTSATSNGYFQVPAVAANYASTPDAAALDITGNITVEAQMAPASWTTGTYYPESKWTGIASTSAYLLSLVAGKIVLSISAGGSIVTATSTANVGLTAGVAGWIAAQRVQSTGVVTFSTSPDGVTWTPLGSTVTIAAGTAINNAAQIVEFGTYNTGATASTVAFPLYRSRVWSDVTRTTLALDANFATKTPCATAFTESSSNAATVTINGAMAQVGDGSIVLNSSTPGTQATMSSSNTQGLELLIYQDTKVTGGPWYPGVHSNSVSNNTGWSTGGIRYGTEAASFTDSASRLLVFARSGTESFGLSDSGSRVAVSMVRTGAETAALGDTATRSAVTAARAGSETVALADTATRLGQTQSRTGTESVPLADSAARPPSGQARTGTESAGLADGASRAPGAAQRSGTESAAATDSAARSVMAQSRAGTESASLADNAVNGGVTNLRAGSESIPLGDTASRSVGLGRGGSESVTLADTAGRSTGASRVGVESTGFADAAMATRWANRSGYETLTITDSATVSFHPAASPVLFTLVSLGTLTLPWRVGAVRLAWSPERMRLERPWRVGSLKT